MATALPEVGFSSAKTDLSSVMDTVVHERHPTLVYRHKGKKEAMLLVRPDDLAKWLESFRVSLRVTLGEGDAAVEAGDLGVVGIGETFEAAMEDLVEELRLYTRRYFEQAGLYMHSDRARHYPQLLRFALTPAEQQLALLYADMEASYTGQREVVASRA
jgi:antitoxin of RelE/RelB toxin-antitoxin system